MRKEKTKVASKILSATVALSMTAMMTPAAAFAANPWDTYVEAGSGDNVSQTVDSISTEYNGGMSYAHDGGGATLSVEGNVSADGEGVWAYASGEDSSAGIYVDGTVTAGRDGVTATAYDKGYSDVEAGDVTASGNYGAYIEAEGTNSVAGAETGNLTSKLGFQVTGESGGEAILKAKEVRATGGSGDVTVPNDVNGAGGFASVYADDIYSAATGLNLGASEAGTAHAQVKKIYADSTGINISNGGGAASAVADGIESAGIGVMSMAWNGAFVNGVQVNGDIIAGVEGAVADGDDPLPPGAVFVDMGGINILSVQGDVISRGGVGLVVSNYRDAKFIGVVDGTISGATDGLSVAGMGLDGIDLTVWKIETGNDGQIIAGDDEEVVAPNIHYIVKVVQPDEGATIKATKEDGSDLERYSPFGPNDGEDDGGFDVAYEGDKILLKVNLEEGYSLLGAYNGEGQEQPLLIDDAGNYYIVVERGGGVYLSVRTIKDAEQFTVEFVNDDGTVLQTGKWDAGAMPAYNGTVPTKAEDDKYTYEFVGWTPTIDKVTGDITYKATFNAIPKIKPAPDPDPTPEPEPTPVPSTSGDTTKTETKAKSYVSASISSTGDELGGLMGAALVMTLAFGSLTFFAYRKQD